MRKAFKLDKQAISDVFIAAFGNLHGQEIADLIMDLCADSSVQPLLSFVADADDNIVGIFYFQTHELSIPSG